MTARLGPNFSVVPRLRLSTERYSRSGRRCSQGGCARGPTPFDPATTGRVIAAAPSQSGRLRCLLAGVLLLSAGYRQGYRHGRKVFRTGDSTWISSAEESAFPNWARSLGKPNKVTPQEARRQRPSVADRELSSLFTDRTIARIIES
jgi:hypothetical protein